MSRTRVLVADPLRIFRAGVKNLLVREADFDVVEAGSLGEVLEAASDDSPDIALIDLDLPPDGGVAATQHLVESSGTHVILWSFEPDGETVLDAVRGGARGYLHKEISPAALVHALRDAAQGEAPLSHGLATLLIDALHGLTERDRVRERARALSAREREVLELVAQGARNRQIAGELTISEFTVKRHIQNILQKLELPSRGAAATLYRAAFGAEQESYAASTSL
jgi:two-component system nitrate/nitrite response regulator NarL